MMPANPEQGNSSNKSTIFNHPYINIPRLSCFSEDSKKSEVDYIQWKFELDTLIQLNFPEAIIIHAMGKSLKPPAANVLRSMGPKPVLSKSLRNSIKLLETFYPLVNFPINFIQ